MSYKSCYFYTCWFLTRTGDCAGANLIILLSSCKLFHFEAIKSLCDQQGMLIKKTVEVCQTQRNLQIPSVKHIHAGRLGCFYLCWQVVKCKTSVNNLKSLFDSNCISKQNNLNLVLKPYILQQRTAPLAITWTPGGAHHVTLDSTSR